MNCSYKDITDKLGEPIWWDEYAVPRYCEFHPNKVGNIYAEEVILLEIGCQECGFRYKVAMSYCYEGKSLTERVQNKQVHYGDPPNYCACSAGATMSCIDIRVLEFWKQEDLEWIRKPELEIEIEGEDFWDDKCDISIDELFKGLNSSDNSD